MPRRKHHDAYYPHAGTTPVRVIVPGPPKDDAGQPIRLQNFHQCGAVIFRGMRDFNGAHYTVTEYFADRTAAGKLIDCPKCGAMLTRDTVTGNHPEEIPAKQLTTDSEDAAPSEPDTERSETTPTP